MQRCHHPSGYPSTELTGDLPKALSHKELPDAEPIPQLDTISGVRNPPGRPFLSPATPSCPADVDSTSSGLTRDPEHMPPRLSYPEKKSPLLFIEIHVPA